MREMCHPTQRKIVFKVRVAAEATKGGHTMEDPEIFGRPRRCQEFPSDIFLLD